MGLLHRLRVCVLVLGLEGAGKSSVCACLQLHKRATAPPPLGRSRLPEAAAHLLRVCSSRRGVAGGKLLALDFSPRESCGEGEQQRLSGERFYPCAQAVLFVMDATTSLQRLQQTQDEVDRTLSHPDLSRVPVLFLLNKGDSPVALGNEAVLEALELGNASGGRRRWAMLRASAATGEGLPEATRWLMENANPGREEKEPEREAERAFALLASGASRVVRVRC